MRITITAEQTLKADKPRPPQIIHMTDLDAAQPNSYVTYLFFLKNTYGEGRPMAGETIKSTLMETLNYFADAAGRLLPPDDDGSLRVDCADQGILWIEAEAGEPMSHFSEHYYPPERLYDDLYRWPTAGGDEQQLVTVQRTTLSDQSTVLAVSFFRQLYDSHGHYLFLRQWADKSREHKASFLATYRSSQLRCSDRDAVLSRPDAYDEPQQHDDGEEIEEANDVEMRMFSASRLALSKIKMFTDKAQTNERMAANVARLNLNKEIGDSNASLVDLSLNQFHSLNDGVLAYLWRCVARSLHRREVDASDVSMEEEAAAATLPNKPTLSSVFSQTCDVRRLLRPRLAETYCGNATAPLAVARLPVDRLCSTESVIGLAEAACAVRLAADSVDNAAVAEAVDWLGGRTTGNVRQHPPESAGDLHVENISKLNFHSLDFGSGKSDAIRLLVQYAGRRRKKGVEAWFLPIRFDAEHAAELALWTDRRLMDTLMSDAEFRKCFREITDQPVAHKHGEVVDSTSSRAGTTSRRTSRLSTRSVFSTLSKKSFFG